MQDVLPFKGEDVPSGQGLHSLAPEVLPKYPAGHDMQVALPAAGLKLPDGQSSHMP